MYYLIIGNIFDYDINIHNCKHFYSAKNHYLGVNCMFIDFDVYLNYYLLISEIILIIINY